ncbi:MAG: hypothetical protein A2Y24_01805 [Clostridiales bacterium GWE2_32_10]|nr:MAG: hypothetical protein A2Y24_01805 [Clostridiales bacterium GWE2_32_10]HBY20044.1 farnesyl-diphosphate synthase [Clostridiales bacterium]
MFKEDLQKRIEHVEELLRKYSVTKDNEAKILFEAMNYSLFAGGKRLRPIMVLEAFNLLNGDESFIAEAFAASTEMIHTFSLIHDDLPAMDNDDYRRGKPTNHKVYGDGIAVLAGDSLLNYAYENIIANIKKSNYKDRCLEAMAVLTNAIGPFGIMGGQTADLINENKKDVEISTLKFIHEYKTTIFIRACLKVGAILAGANNQQVEALDKYGHNIGFAFQIQDDILDVVGNSEELGKPVGSDQKNDKTTYVKLLGLDESKEEVKTLTNEAIKIILDEFGRDKAKFLIDLAEYLKNRTK